MNTTYTPAWTRVNVIINAQIKNHRKGGLLFGGGGGNRLVSRCSRCIARPLGQRQAMLDETLTSPRVPRVRFPSIRIINKKAIQKNGWHFY